jgi:voltage-gated potassium channel
MNQPNSQLRLAIFILLTLIPIGTIGFMILDQRPLGEAIYFTVITLATVGYGDISPTNDLSRAFVVILVPFGLGAFAFAIQAIYFYVFANPALTDVRINLYNKNRIAKLDGHFIICGTGELADKTIGYIHQNSPRRSVKQMATSKFFSWLRSHEKTNPLAEDLLVITWDKEYAQYLREKRILVICGNTSDRDVLSQCGIERAKAILVMGDNDTDTLLTVLTVRSLNNDIAITATVLDRTLAQKVLRVGATNVIAPFALSANFLNTATFRPAVSSFFMSVTFDMTYTHIMIEARIGKGSIWIGKCIADLQLPSRFDAHPIGMRKSGGQIIYILNSDIILEEEDSLFVVGDRKIKTRLYGEAKSNNTDDNHWQYLPHRGYEPKHKRSHTFLSSEESIKTMNKHFIVCGAGQVASAVIEQLNPDRSFVIVTMDEKQTEKLLERGFRVITGDISQETVLEKAGIKRAQGIMITTESEAESVLAILSSRTLNRHVLITATAYTDDMVIKLQRAGADRVMSPLDIAANFVVLSTLHPNMMMFLYYVIFNYSVQIETTELYMENDSPWIGQTVASLNLVKDYQASVVGIRRADKQGFIYAPANDYVIQAQEVLIIITPMKHGDELRDLAHANENKRPSTLRTRVIESQRWSMEELKRLMQESQSAND